MDQATVATVDGEVLTLHKARRQATILFWCGFLCLPLCWLTNVWLFWPEFIAARDPVLTKYTRWSAFLFSICTAIFLPWFLFFVTVGDRYLSEDTYNKLDVTRLPISDYIGF